MKTAVIYARYSSNNQTEQSIEGQVRVCQEYAKQHDILIIGQYIDRAISGTTDKRPDFQQMLIDSKKKEWNYVLVYRYDRFSRDIYASVIHEQELNNRGIQLISATEQIPETSEGGILKGVIQLMNNYYVKELRQKVKRGMRETRLKGHFQGGTVPYGYKLNNKKLEVDEEHAKIVNHIYNQYAIDVPVISIINGLTARGILYNNKPFKPNVIYTMLKNEKYTGVYKIDDQVYTNIYPQIISNDLFDRVRRKTEENRIGSKSSQSVYMFRHKLRCGYCGMPISADTSRNRYNTQFQYYKCLGVKKYKNGCIKDTIQKGVLEELLMNAIVEELAKPETFKLIVKNVLQLQEEHRKENSNLVGLVNAKIQAQKSLDNIVLAVEQGLITKTTGQRIKDLETQIEDLEKQIMVEKSNSCSVLTEDEIKQFYKTALKQSGLALINYIIKEVKLYNDKAEIIFNTPIKKSPNNKDSSFLSINKSARKMITNKTTKSYIHLELDFCI